MKIDTAQNRIYTAKKADNSAFGYSSGSPHTKDILVEVAKCATSTKDLECVADNIPISLYHDALNAFLRKYGFLSPEGKLTDKKEAFNAARNVKRFIKKTAIEIREMYCTQLGFDEKIRIQQTRARMVKRAALRSSYDRLFGDGEKVPITEPHSGNANTPPVTAAPFVSEPSVSQLVPSTPQESSIKRLTSSILRKIRWRRASGI